MFINILKNHFVEKSESSIDRYFKYSNLTGTIFFNNMHKLLAIYFIFALQQN